MTTKSIRKSSEILDHEVSLWIAASVSDLESGRVKFCSANALRFLHWAHEIFDTSPIVASFCALNATEETVAAFIAAAKKHGHREYAKEVNLHDHQSKAMVSIFAQRCSRVAKQGRLSVAVNPNKSALACRVYDKGDYRYSDLHLNSFRILPNTEIPSNGEIALGDTPPIEDLKAEAERVAEARNKLLYATNKGIQTGFKDPRAFLLRETQLSLGLIWASVDICMNPDQDRPFINQVLEMMASLNKKCNAKRC